MVRVFGYPQGYARSTQRPGRGMGSGEPAMVPRGPPGGSPLHAAFPRGLRYRYGPARTLPVQPGFSAQVDVAPRILAKVGLDQGRHRH